MLSITHNSPDQNQIDGKNFKGAGMPSFSLRHLIILLLLILTLTELVIAESYTAQTDSVALAAISKTLTSIYGNSEEINICPCKSNNGCRSLARYSDDNRVEELDLSNFYFKQWPSELFTLTAMKRLFIKGDTLRLLPPEIGLLVKLEELTITGVKLDSIPEELFTLTSLKKLNLSENPSLKTISPAIGNLINLEILDLYDCGLTELPESIIHCTNLQKLWISNNKLQTIPSGMNSLVNLRSLYAYGNPLVSLPDDLFPLPNLVEFDVQDSRLTSIPEGIGESSHLRYLNAKSTGVTTISASLAKVVGLSINVSNTPLDSLPDEIIEASRLEKIEVLGAVPVMPCDQFRFVHNAAFLDSGCIGKPLDTSIYKVVILSEMWHSDTMNVPLLFHPSGLKINYFPRREAYGMDKEECYHGLLIENNSATGNLYSFGKMTNLREPKKEHIWKAPKQVEIVAYRTTPDDYDTVITVIPLDERHDLTASILKNRATGDTVTYNEGIPYLLSSFIAKELNDSTTLVKNNKINCSFSKWQLKTPEERQLLVEKAQDIKHQNSHPPVSIVRALLYVGYPQIIALDLSIGRIGRKGIGPEFFVRPGVTGVSGGVGIQVIPNRNENVSIIDPVIWARATATYMYNNIRNTKGALYIGPELGLKNKVGSLSIGWMFETDSRNDHSITISAGFSPAALFGLIKYGNAIKNFYGS